MSAIWSGSCAAPGPYATHCTDYPGHRYSCYDASDDVSFNDRQDFRHDCAEPGCDRQHFDNEGD